MELPSVPASQILSTRANNRAEAYVKYVLYQWSQGIIVGETRKLKRYWRKCGGYGDFWAAIQRFLRSSIDGKDH